MRFARFLYSKKFSDGELVGSVAAFAGSSLPSGWLLCDGSAVSRTTYSALFSVIGTTYGNGNGNTTFNLPNLTDKFIQGNSTSGTVKNAGLPNITGDFSRIYTFNDGVTTSGAFGSSSYATTQGPYTNGDNNNKAATYNFNASRSSNIYGNSTTVQPPALTMCYAIYTGNVGKYCWLRQS